ncbi:MAG: hypothetical protein H0W63_07665 [Gemmatimonadaceae bacterium]|nr:hypothetical protein [Gemmatimonadaceae bacterium]
MSLLSEEELDVMVDRERTKGFPPLNDWDTIAARLREEGIIRDRGRRVVTAGGNWWLRAAAVVMIAIGSAAVGRYTATRLPDQTSVAVATAEPTPARQASNTAPTAGSTDFRSADEAWAVLNRAGAEYQKASAYLAANNSVQNVRADSAPVYQSRLAALDQVMQATHSALNQAPNDPVINQYYLATMGAREATRQQLSAVQTVGAKLKGF